ncbi:16S rRNA (guanine(527)-N(7))-methyltransferase RsmG [candidate division KSB1 bacterium]|nr:16S rRNA (guanine(527)-N(7))-methyltransferase RsmG [candidate division KSB1 bacterium]
MLPQNQKELNALSKELDLTGEQIDRFSAYINLLEQWNQRTNLVSGNDIASIVSKHIRESLEILFLDILKGRNTIMDMGTGAGFPGIPLSILKPQLDMTLVESKKMKTLFLQDVVSTLKLQNVNIICQRVENIKGDEFLFQYDVVLARAVTQLKKLWFWGKPLLKNNGLLIAYKGGDMDKEIKELLKKDKQVELKNYPFRWSNSKDDKKIVVVYRQAFS